MSPKTASGERQEILDLANLFVKGAARDGGMIAVDPETRHLLDSHPDSEMSFSELHDAIARIAISRGVGIEFGWRKFQTESVRRRT